MDIKNIFILWAAAMLLPCVVAAQTQEIRSQNVPYGGLAQQYAVVQMVQTGGGTYIIACPDCWAYAEISQNNVVIESGNMTESQTGLFDYRLTGQYRIGGVYYMRCSIYSPTYGNGTADSYLTIQSRTAATTSPPVGDGVIDDLIDVVLPDWVTPVQKIFSDLFKPITDFIGAFQPALELMKSLIQSGLDLIKWLAPWSSWISENVRAFISDLIKDPVGALWSYSWWYLTYAFTLAFLGVGGILIAVEVVGCMVNVNYSEPVGFLSGMMRYNLSVLRLTGAGFWKIGQTIGGIITGIRNLKGWIPYIG